MKKEQLAKEESKDLNKVMFKHCNTNTQQHTTEEFLNLLAKLRLLVTP
jgi:hypothetical protein